MSEAIPAPESVSEVPAAKPARERAGLRDYADSLLVTIVLVLFGTSFVVQAFKIPSHSMEPTLLVGDHLLVNKFIFGGRGEWYERVLPYRAIRRGDIIVFKYPFDDHAHYVKRVIALPGDRLKIVNRDVYVNGELLPEPYAVHDPNPSYDPFLDNFPPTSDDFFRRGMHPQWASQVMSYVDKGELVVPPGKYFALGDNRDQSQDSRYWGFVDRESIMGRPILVYWSIESTSDDYSDRSWVGRIVGLGHTVVNLPRKTRWHRLFRFVS